MQHEVLISISQDKIKPLRNYLHNLYRRIVELEEDISDIKINFDVFKYAIKEIDADKIASINELSIRLNQKQQELTAITFKKDVVIHMINEYEFQTKDTKMNKMPFDMSKDESQKFHEVVNEVNQTLNFFYSRSNYQIHQLLSKKGLFDKNPKLKKESIQKAAVESRKDYRQYIMKVCGK